MSGREDGSVASALVKVPEVGAVFWAAKVLSTGMGETTSDYLTHRINPFLAGAIGGVAFLAALWWQLRADRYVAPVYWTAVVMVAVFGTMAADGLHVELGVPYALSTTFYVLVLAAVFATWYRVEGTLDIHSISTRRRELFYWAAVLATFALGTAVGDLTAITLHLGFFASGLLFVGLIALPALGWWRFGISPIFSFWAAYVVTRPLGASFADWFGVSHARGGLGYGTLEISLVLLAVIAVLVAYLTAAQVRGTRLEAELDVA